MSASMKRLMCLPECFTDKTFMRLSGLSPESAAVSLSRMKAEGLVASAGSRSGIYFNLLRNPNAAADNRIAALLMVYPTTILCGESVLHNAGWITQIPSAVSVCVLARNCYQQLDGFAITGRPMNWFRSVHRQLLKPEKAGFATYGLRSTTPEMAVAHVLSNGRGLGPDDFDIPDDQMPAVLEAIREAGCENPFAPKETDGRRRRSTAP